MRTGASRLIRFGVPVRKRSRTRSARTRTRWPARRSELAAEQPPGLVVADQADGEGLASERPDVGYRIGAASGHAGLAGVAQDEDRRLAADPLRGAGEKAVEDEIGEDEDPLAGEAV